LRSLGRRCAPGVDAGVEVGCSRHGNAAGIGVVPSGIRKRPSTEPVTVSRTVTSMSAPDFGTSPQLRPPRANWSDASTANDPSCTLPKVTTPSLDASSDASKTAFG